MATTRGSTVPCRLLADAIERHDGPVSLAATVTTQRNTRPMSATADDAAPKLPLRARKKAKTRQSIIEISQRRFIEKGFAATTLEEIGDEADVHVRTILRYFPTKEALALVPEHDLLESLEIELATPDREATVLQVWHEYLDRVGAALRQPLTLQYALFIAGEPTLHAHKADVLRQHEDLLAEHLQREVRGGKTQKLRARLLAAMLVGGMAAVARDWVVAGGRGDLRKSFGEVLDQARLAFPEFV